MIATAVAPVPGTGDGVGDGYCRWCSVAAAGIGNVDAADTQRCRRSSLYRARAAAGEGDSRRRGIAATGTNDGHTGDRTASGQLSGNRVEGHDRYQQGSRAAARR